MPKVPIPDRHPIHDTPTTVSQISQYLNRYNHRLKLPRNESLGLGLLLQEDTGGTQNYARPLAEYVIETSRLRYGKNHPAWLNEQFAHTALAAYYRIGGPAERRRFAPDEERTAKIVGSLAVFEVIAEAREAVAVRAEEVGTGRGLSAAENLFSDIGHAFILLTDLVLAAEDGPDTGAPQSSVA